MSTDQFIETYREEHRAFRDQLLELIQAFKDRDKRRIKSLLDRVVETIGPHMRCEEEALYPALTEFFLDAHIEHLMIEHDQLIATIRTLIQMRNRKPLSDDDVRVAELYIRSLLTHVADCDGLLILVERLPEEKMRKVLRNHRRARREGLDLLRYASEARGRLLRAASLRMLWT